MTPGVYPMTAADYHADPCPEPSVSSGYAATMISQSPMHAAHEHPRLNPNLAPDEPSGQQDEGSALHALLLEQRDLVEPVDAADWRTKAAQEARKAAREAGRIPLLAERWTALQFAADAMRDALRQHEVGDFLARPGRAEHAMIWQDESEVGPVWCRARPDWLADDVPVIFDIKTVGGSANPDAWGRTAMGNGAPLQAAHYLRGARILGLPHRRFLFVVMEREAPFGVSVIELSPALLQMADEQLAYVRNMHAACLRDGEWPGYPGMIATLEAPNWLAYSHDDWKARMEQVRQRKPKPFANVATETILKAEQPFA